MTMSTTSSTRNSRKRKQPHAQSSEQSNPKRMRLAACLTSNMQKAMTNEALHDVEFVVGNQQDQETFRGSRIFFAIHSKVLESMLYGSMQESLSEAQVIIPDVSPLAFQYLMRLVYNHHPQLNHDIVIHVLYLAQKYLMDVLVQECKDYALLVDQLSDFYKILHSFTYYPPSTFDTFLSQFLLKCKCNQNYKSIRKIMEHNKFVKLPIYMIQILVKSKLITTEQSKYIHCKEYCRINSTVLSDKWQPLFKLHFRNLIDFSRIKSDFLLSIVRKDGILSDVELLNIWEIKTKRDKPGFKIEELYLSYDECMQLCPDDRVDVRCCTGEIVNGKITDNGVLMNDVSSNIVHEVCVVYNDAKDTPIQEFVSLDDQRLMMNGCISSRKGISKICMQNLEIDQNVFVNMAFLPSKAYHGVTNMNSRWIECTIIGFWKQKKQIKVRSTGDTLDGDYYFHPDSKDEVACSIECEYCCYN
eukprot:411541_1